MADREAYEMCRRMTALHGKTYYFSTLFFPAAIRPSVFALYGFVRHADEIVDNPPSGSCPEESLCAFRAAAADALIAGESDLPVLDAFAETTRRHNMPHHYALAFLDAMAMDLTQTRYETFEDLKTYTYGSASAVGLMMCHIIGATQADAFAPAHDLGLAMQLTNFLRDTGEDWCQRGRIYLPLEDMRRFGYTEDDLARGVVNDPFRELIKFEVARTRELYARADEGMKMIPIEARYAVRLARCLYSRILNKIEENGYDIFRKRATVGNSEKLLISAREGIRHHLEARAEGRGVRSRLAGVS